MNWTEQTVLVTGGTGSFGREFVEIMLQKFHPKQLVIFSRDELKQHDMRAAGIDHASLCYFIGDVRDPGRPERALSGVTIVIHAAALKQVLACVYNPFEAIQTNIVGGRNVIDAAINQGVARTLALSTDKAVNPINLGKVSNGIRHGAIVSNRSSNEVIKQGDRGSHSTILSLSSVRRMARLNCAAGWGHADRAAQVYECVSSVAGRDESADDSGVVASLRHASRTFRPHDGNQHSCSGGRGGSVHY
jgi:NAD(P)-dependent dehydrogenase (short-subunit alcohol dehydrogenase family)